MTKTFHPTTKTQQFQNVRAGYVTAFLDHLVNWDWVNQQVKA